MTSDEYAAIGRRVATGEFCPAVDLMIDRDALWELCERLMEKLILWEQPNGATALLCESSVVYPTRESAVKALLESLGGADG